MQYRMGRVKLKIKRVETNDIIFETYAKRKKILIQEAILKEEKQNALVKVMELRLKELEDKVKEVKTQVHELRAEKKDLEDGLKQASSLQTPSQDPKKLRRRNAVLKKQEARLKTLTEEEKIMNELLVIADHRTLEEREKLISDIDVERAKVKQLELDRNEIEREAYMAIKEGLWDKFDSHLDAEFAKDAKKLEQNIKEIEKGASLTSKESIEKKLSSGKDDKRARAKQSKKNDQFLEPGNDQFANDVGQSLALNPEMPMSKEEATPAFVMVKDEKIPTIEIGGMNVPMCEPSLLAAHPKKPLANP